MIALLILLLLPTATPSATPTPLSCVAKCGDNQPCIDWCKQQGYK